MERKLEKRKLIQGLEQYKKALYIIDMNNGFVNFGNMANPEYNLLVPEQLKLVEKIRKEKGVLNFILDAHTPESRELREYPVHCLIGSEEAQIIPELISEQDQPDTMSFYKNSINGILESDVQKSIKSLKNLREAIFCGVCADLCVMDFVRSYARFLDMIDHEAKLFVVKNAIDTFDGVGHNRKEWLDISYKVMEQAGVIVVDDINELEEQERKLGLYRK